MRQYKLSKYVFVDEREKDVFLYNTNKLDMIRMRKTKYIELLSELDSDSIDIRQPKINYLITNAYIVKNDTDENRLADFVYMQTCHSSKQLLITILPTEGCNFRCEYCYEEHKQNVMSENIQAYLIKFVRNNIKYYGGLSVSWFGGEPLLQPEIIEYLSSEFKKICKNYKKPYNAIMTTNGYLLTYEMFQRMKKCSVTNYQITLDGLAEMHDKQRFLAGGLPTFNTIVNNLKEIKSNEKSRLYTFSIRTNLTVQSLNTYPKFAEFLNKTFLDDERFKQRVRLAWNGTSDKEYDANVISNWSDVSGSDFSDLQSRISRNVSDIENEGMLRENFLELMYAHYPCYAAKSNSFIFGPDGRVFKCTVHFDDSKDGVIGVLNDSGHIEINDEICVKWITQLTAEQKEKCYECVVYPICQGVSCPYKMSISGIGLKNEDCDYKRDGIISTYRIFSANTRVCRNIEEI